MVCYICGGIPPNATRGCKLTFAQMCKIGKKKTSARFSLITATLVDCEQTTAPLMINKLIVTACY
jgi:hypothetical protein